MDLHVEYLAELTPEKVEELRRLVDEMQATNRAGRVPETLFGVPVVYTDDERELGSKFKPRG